MLAFLWTIFTIYSVCAVTYKAKVSKKNWPIWLICGLLIGPFIWLAWWLFKNK